MVNTTQQDEWEEIESSPVWNFKENPQLIGYFVGVETKVGPNESNLYSFRLEDGEMVAVWGNTLLDSRFRHLEIGEKVKVIYKGKVKNPKTGREYHNYDVFHSKARHQESKLKSEDIPIVEGDYGEDS